MTGRPATWSSCSPDFGIKGVLDRFGQIQPKVIFTADGYFFKGKHLDSLERISNIIKKLPSIEKLVVVPYTEKNPDIIGLPNAILYKDFKSSESNLEIEFEQLPFDREVRTLSGGERHRLAMIRSLLWNPRVIVADEPLAGLDPDIASVCLELLLRFGRRPGRLLVCVLHDPEMSAHADSRLRLANGQLKGVA